MLVGAMVVCVVLTMGLVPGSPAGRLLRRWLVEIPAARLSEASPRRVLIGAIVLAVLAGFAIAAPELLPFVGMVDLTAFVDLAVLVLLAGGWRQIRRAVEAAARFAGRRAAPLRLLRFHRRAARPRRVRKPSGDDDPAPGWAFA